MPGPAPNRSDNLTRESNANRANRPDVKTGELREATVPNVPRDWHTTARRVFNSLKTSGQADYFQDSDWAYAYLLCEQIDRYEQSSKPSAMMFAEIQKGLTNLMFTESDRRRARIELSAPEDQGKSASVTAIEAAKASLGLVQGDKA